MTKEEIILSGNKASQVKNLETRIINFFETEKNVDAVADYLKLTPKEKMFLEKYSKLTAEEQAEARYLCSDFDREGLIIKNSMDLIEYVKK